jgi:epoxide hydrolase-like predicted phosphatase
MDMIRAIIFDCFGVLTTESFGLFRDKYFEGTPEKRAEANKLMDKLNTGQLAYDVFLNGLVDLSGASIAVVNDYMTRNKPNEPLFNFMRKELKPKYKLGLLSNAGDNWLKEIFSQKDMDLFDDIVLSYELGVIKPDPKIYEVAANRLKVLPSECVFIDDNPGHCNGGAKVGMKTICYKNLEQTKKDLERLLPAGPNN